MSAESLEDGEIASEHEKTPEVQEVDDEVEIDRIIENNQPTTSQKVISSPVKKSPDSEPSRRRTRGRKNRKNDRFPTTQPPSLMATSWHTIGNGNNNTGGQQHQRQPPPESVIFGIQNPSPAPPPEQFLPPPPPPPVMNNQQMIVSPDITRLQNIVNHQRDYYTPPPQQQQQARVPFHFFQSPPPDHHHPIRTPLMSIPMQQPPPPPPHQTHQPHQPHRPLPPLLPHPPPQRLQPLPTPPNPPNNTSWRHADNYERMDMDMSPEEPPPEQFNGFPRPPIQIPLDPVVAASSSSGSSPDGQKSQKAPEEDEASLRAFLLANLVPNGKRPASSAGTPGRVDAEPKRIRKSSAPRLSTSVENIFGAKPVQPPPTVPKIQVNIGKVATEPEVAPAPAPEPTAPPPSLVESIQQSTLSREEKREQLEKRKLEIEKQFQEQREKVTEAAKNSKVAATMAAKAEELAKQAEKMNQEAVELRQKCIESTRVGKEEMRKILIEKRELQTAIDEMSIDDMEEIDVEEFPCIFFASVKPASEQKDEKPVVAKVESVASSSNLTAPRTPEASQPRKEAPSQDRTASVTPSSSLSAPRAPEQKSAASVASSSSSSAPVAQVPSLTAAKSPPSNLTIPAPLAQVLTSPRAPVALASRLTSPRAASSNSTTQNAPSRSPAAPRAPEPVQEQRQVGGRNPTRDMEQLARIQPEDVQIVLGDESENEHDQSEDNEEHVEEEEEEEEEEEAEQSVEGEDEYETEDEVVEIPQVLRSPLMSPLKSSKEVQPFSKKVEEEMRARLLNKFNKNDASRKSPDAEKVSSSSQNPEEHAAECRAVLQRMCKFELNGKCERPRDCQFLHMHNINDTKQQTQILESLFRDVFQYQEADIAGAVAQTMHFLPEFRAFEKLMDQFFRVVVQQTPDFKPRLFQFFAQVRR